MKNLRDFFSQFATNSAESPVALAEKLLTGLEAGNMNDVRQAVAAGADPNCRNDMRETALIVATKEKLPEAVALLLENKADVTRANDFGQTALHYALREQPDDAIALTLIAAGAPLDGADEHGSTPAFYAAQTGKAGVIAVLAEKGASLKTPNRDGMTPVMMGLHHAAAVDELLKHDFGIDVQDNAGYSVLMQAALQERTDLVQRLLDLGANVNLKTKEGETASSLARRHGIGGGILTALEQRENGHAEQFHSGSEQVITPMKKITFVSRRTCA